MEIARPRGRLYLFLLRTVTGLALAGLALVAFLSAGADASTSRPPEVVAMGALLYGLGAVAGAALLRVAHLSAR